MLSAQEMEHFREEAVDASQKDQRRRIRCVVCDMSMLRNADTLKAHLKSRGHVRSVDKQQRATCTEASGETCTSLDCLTSIDISHAYGTIRLQLV